MPDATIQTPAEKLYRSSKPHRRVLFLELMAWAITHIEEDDTAEFRDELKDHRQRFWGRRPWAGAATDDAEFLKHVENMALVFANCDGAGDAWYPNRQHGPLGGMDIPASS